MNLNTTDGRRISLCTADELLAMVGMTKAKNDENNKHRGKCCITSLYNGH